uniref:Uncharacterized protein n=1 Tax=Crocodylus porosus TaxID=8502 RepID=A0A7M4ETB6_CROPO
MRLSKRKNHVGRATGSSMCGMCAYDKIKPILLLRNRCCGCVCLKAQKYIEK